ncbi:uncharacterized protein LOC121415753 [Lytechinus variegatus]|uniref:uncharacterized protein LOC121415753 n=1 Tax=Lytechinus variegatus TaxID=7654 RepID=UPI001BB1D485|nr:uncharacterized protein LOC121415753 [Lytechinus variegatus]
MGVVRRLGIKHMLLFFAFFVLSQLLLAILPSNPIGNPIGDLREFPVLNDQVVYPRTDHDRKVLEIGQGMLQDFKETRDNNSNPRVQSQKASDVDQGNGRALNKEADPLAVLPKRSGPDRTKMQDVGPKKVNVESRSKVKYILPVLLGNQGTNNQIQAVKLVSIIAQRRNLTLVLAPFFDHGPTLEKQLPHTFEETLDPDVLSEFVPVATMEEFESQCNQKADVVFLGTNMVINQSQSQTDQVNQHVGDTIEIYYNWTRIKIPSTFLHTNHSDGVIQIAADLPYYVAVDDFLDRYPDSLTTTHKCNAFLYPYGYLGRLVYWEHISRYTKYFVRGKEVRAIAQNFIKTALQNNSYVCIHWRFNEEWKNGWCKKDYAADLCNSLDALTPSKLAMAVSKFMAENGLKGAYFASELDNANYLIQGLRTGVVNCFMTGDLIDGSPKLSRHNNYLTSLVEQEICKESAFFLSSRLSSWSDMVKQDRFDQKWREVNTLF